MLRIILVDGRKMELIWAETLSESQRDLKGAGDRLAPVRSSILRPIDVFLAHRDRLRCIAAGMGLSGVDIEDCLQDVSVKALENTGQFDSDGNCLSWLARVTINRCLTMHRRRKSFLKRASEVLKRMGKPPNASPAGRAVKAEELEIVRLGLKELDGSMLAPLVLKYFCELDSTEIARVLDLNASTVRSHLRKARMILAGKLVQKGVKP